MVVHGDGNAERKFYSEVLHYNTLSCNSKLKNVKLFIIAIVSMNTEYWMRYWVIFLSLHLLLLLLFTLQLSNANILNLKNIRHFKWKIWFRFSFLSHFTFHISHFVNTIFLFRTFMPSSIQNECFNGSIEKRGRPKSKSTERSKSAMPMSKMQI